MMNDSKIDPRYRVPSLDHAAIAIMAQGLAIAAAKRQEMLDMENVRLEISHACGGDQELIAYAMGVLQR